MNTKKTRGAPTPPTRSSGKLSLRSSVEELSLCSITRGINGVPKPARATHSGEVAKAGTLLSLMVRTGLAMMKRQMTLWAFMNLGPNL